jgi:hypothetical protein
MNQETEPTKGFEVAIPVALRRGRVMQFRPSPAYVSSFMFYGNGLLVLVSLRLARKLFHATLNEISAEYADAIAGLCTIPCGGPVCRELWLYSRYGALRFFRVGADDSLEEIDRDGVPFVDGKPVGASPPAPGDAGSPAPAPGGSVPATGVPAGSGGADPPDHILRWLAKRNAMKKSVADGAGTTNSAEPGKIPDAGSRGPAPGTLPGEPGSSPPGPVEDMGGGTGG